MRRHDCIFDPFDVLLFRWTGPNWFSIFFLIRWYLYLHNSKYGARYIDFHIMFVNGSKCAEKYAHTFPIRSRLRDIELNRYHGHVTTHNSNRCDALCCPNSKLNFINSIGDRTHKCIKKKNVKNKHVGAGRKVPNSQETRRKTTIAEASCSTFARSSL